MLVLRRQLMLLLALAVLAPPLAAAEMKSVAVTAIVEHPALDAARDGIRETLAEAGWKDGEGCRPSPTRALRGTRRRRRRSRGSSWARRRT